MSTGLSCWENPQFDYISLRTAFEELFVIPFPMKIGSRSTHVELHKFFSVVTSTEKNPSAAVVANNTFYEAYEGERNSAFTALCQFLKKYNIGYRDCILVPVTNNNYVESQNKIPPCIFSYQEKRLPCIDEEKNEFYILYESWEMFSYHYVYYRGKKPPQHSSTLQIGYPYECFYSFGFYY